MAEPDVDEEVLVPGNAREEDRQVPMSSFSVHGSRVSGSSRHSKTSRVSVSMIELKERHLKERLAQEMKELQEKQKGELLAVSQELEAAKLADELSERNSVCSFNPVDDKGKVFEFVQRHTRLDTEDVKRPISRRDLKNDEPEINSKPLVSPSPRPTLGVDLPKVELMSFDGRPTVYWKFIRQFQVYVASKTDDDGQRLLYLIHYCKGKAREAIEECVMLPPESGYRRACGILKDLYGRSHEVARSLLDGLLDGLNTNRFDADTLSSLAIRMEGCMISLEQMDYTADLNSLTTLERIVKELPYSLQCKWAENVDRVTQNGREPNFSELTEFVSTMARIARSRFGKLASSDKRTDRPYQPVHSTSKRQFGTTYNVNTISNANESRMTRCVMCTEIHALSFCPKFLELEVPARWDIARRYGMCFICLKGSHRANACNTRIRCNLSGCGGRHHQLLHLISQNSDVPPTLASEGHCAVTRLHANNICLGLVPVKLRAGGKEAHGYALLDNGSDTTLITVNALRQMDLGQQRSHLTIKTVGGSTEANFVSHAFQVLPLDESEAISIEQAVVVQDLPIPKPMKGVSEKISGWPHLTDLPVKDIDGEVLILIGCDVPEAHWVLEQRLGGRKHPYAVRTLLGWVIFGPSSYTTYQTRSVNCVTAEESTLTDQLMKMYDAEFADVQLLDKGISADDADAVAIVESGTRFVDGHFVVPLPWRKEVTMGTSNYASALTRLHNLKRRLSRDETLRVRYTNTMEMTIAKGYALPVSRHQIKCGYQPCWYLPHHAVLNPKKPEKLRIVLDCAAKHRGRSLNDMLYQGPDTTADLVGILLRFRRERIAVSADIEEMFMQVKVPENDRNALRFLWWPEGDLSKEPEEYEMTAHPFGATSSPFCANFALRRAAQEFGEGYAHAVLNAVKCDFYVDDCLASFPNSEAAISYAKGVTDLLMRAGFRLRKWTSNSSDFAAALSDSGVRTDSVQLPQVNGTCQRALGVQWDTIRDVFTFEFQSLDKPITRRGILSSISSWFDPLGLVAPLCLPAKLLLQKLCKSKTGWDQPLDRAEANCWEEWIRFVRQLDKIKIQRSIRIEDENEIGRTELHVFCDASEIGYGAVAYAWRIPVDKVPYSVLLFCKSRVAPIKSVSIPRLELSAAVLGIKIGEVIKKALPDTFSEICYWTDSMIVRYYVQNTSTRFSTFVANRLAVVHQFSTVSQWRHVRSEDNIADLVSRGITTEKALEKWLKGPSFLQDYVPLASHPTVLPPDGIELKKGAAVVNTAFQSTSMTQLLSHYSDWSKLLRAVAWILRFISYMKVMFSKKRDGMVIVGTLSAEEIEEGRLQVLRLIQKDAFGDFLPPAGSDGLLSKKMQLSLKKLCPVTVEGLLCVGGRLCYTSYPTSFKHQVILPNKNFVTDLVIRHYHSREGHSGTSHVLSAIREKYWIVKGIGAVKRVIGRCILCRKITATAGQQMMAPLPLCRVQKGWCCFESVGMDYFGPLVVRRGRGSEKKYGCLFTCLQTRAVHLEIAGSLTTDSFILCLMRFVGRRGRPSEIYSDNGSNFVGAVSELKEAMSRWDGRRISDRLANEGIKWHFNPPSSSHRGGVWERIIRSVRRLLYVLTKEQLLSEETLSTCFVEIERILNNRPLVPCVADDNGRSTLSPNSLLLMKENVGIQEGVSMKENYVRRWRQVNHFANNFWRRWMKEYIPTLQIRQKWLSEHRNFKIGDLVLVAAETTTRGKWPMGVVDAVEMDADGLVRTAMVRTNNGKMRRDVRRLCLLEGAD